ncbi:HD-GYP domain-containing protein [Paenibacillus farraposensis]|uniref:HD-GYP domain-containing protein n=1 Tax=Paenibacillus farraposensis TaxID=2807095 RepID=A0ABW4DEE5_9BACL|nr:HD-GYP domain-containing protein [Paenibacillus farraposensis]MCC3378509.1 HD-GYP domain-containing protein [Paenibacillus farraposensis]
MATVPVSELKAGLRLQSDVFTEMGSLLLPKGRILLPRDLEILQAFLIQQVEVGTDDITTSGGDHAAVRSGATESQAPLLDERDEFTRFQDEYDKMVMLVKSAFQSILVSNLSIYELRGQLESLLVYIQRYNVMTFAPRSMGEVDYIFHNAVLTSLTSYSIAQWIGLPQKDWMQVAFAGLLHDIGNAKMDPSILYKSSALTKEEQEEIHRHASLGYQLLRNVKAINEGVRLAALQHHEKVDGTGYPLRLKGEQIHIYSKIVAVADVFHAMTLEKTYRPAQSPYLVLEQIKSESFGKLDPNVVQVFIHKLTQFNNGTKVRLNDNRTGEIIFADRDYPTRPLVQVDGEIINLMLERELYIECIVLD